MSTRHDASSAATASALRQWIGLQSGHDPPVKYAAAARRDRALHSLHL